MICIIPVHTLPANGIELKYALRSIDKYAPEIEDVVLIGDHKPTWFLGDFQPWKQNPKLTGVANVMAKLAHYCGLYDFQTGADPRVVITSDDQYWLKPWRINPPRHMSKSPSRANVHDTGFKRAIAALKRRGIPEPHHDYELHCPIIVNSDRLANLLHEEGHDTPLAWRTLYGNMYTRDSVPLLDVKTMAFVKPQEVRPFYSSSDQSATDPIFLKWANEKFPEVSRWEIDYLPRPK